MVLVWFGRESWGCCVQRIRREPASIDSRPLPPSHPPRTGRQTMHLMYYMNAAGKRVYTLKKETPNGEITYSAHPGKGEGREGRGGEEGMCWRVVELCLPACRRPTTSPIKPPDDRDVARTPRGTLCVSWSSCPRSHPPPPHPSPLPHLPQQPASPPTTSSPSSV